MKIVTRLAVVLVIAAACFSPFTNAQSLRATPNGVVPRLVNVSGKAVEVQENVLSGVVGITFAN